MVDTASTLVRARTKRYNHGGSSTIASIKISETHSKARFFTCGVSSLRQVLRRQDEFRAGMRGWAEDADAWSSTCAILCQNGCHFGHLQVYKWKPEAVATCTRPWTCDQGLLLAVSISNKIRRKATDKGTVARNYWMNDPKTLAESQSFTSFSGLFSMQWNEWNCFASLSVRHDLSCSTTGEATTTATWLLTVWHVSGCREAGCFGIPKIYLLGASVSKLQNSKGRRLSTRQCDQTLDLDWLRSLEFHNGPSISRWYP